MSTNAGGNRVLRYGMARDLVLGVEAVLADGTVIDALRKVIKNNSGYDLRQLFIGAEGTLGVVTAVVLRLFPKPRSVCTGICAVDDYAAVLELLQRARGGFGSQLTAFEVMWPALLPRRHRGLGRKPPLELGHGAYVLIETLGTDPEADQQRYETVIGEAMEAGSVRDAIIAQSQREATELWAVRDSPGEWRKAGFWPQLGFDVSVPTGEIGALVDEIERRAERALAGLWRRCSSAMWPTATCTSRCACPVIDPGAGNRELVYGIVAKRRGSISAEHGIGSLKKDFLHLSRSPAEIGLMRAIKRGHGPEGHPESRQGLLKKTPRKSRRFLARHGAGQFGGSNLLRDRLLEHAIDLFVRRIDARLGSLRGSQRLVRRALRGSGGRRGGSGVRGRLGGGGGSLVVLSLVGREISLQGSRLRLEGVHLGLQRLEVDATSECNNSGRGSHIHQNCLVH